MKLVCKALAGHKFALPEGLVEVDVNGVIEVQDHVAEVLKGAGFEEIVAPKKEAKKEEPKKEEVKKEEPKKEEAKDLKFARK